MDNTTKRAFLICGAESSGSRFVTEAFIAAGCDGESGHHQRFDTTFHGAADIIVWRRSFPHGGYWPNIFLMKQTLSLHEYYDVTMIITLRDYYSMIESQIKAGHITDREQGEQNIHSAYARIFAESRRLQLPIRLAVYDAYVHNPKTLERLLQSCHLTLQKPLSIYDANAKYSGDLQPE